MKKLVIVAWTELTLRARDPSLWLLTLVAPLLVAALISLAFGGLVLGQSIPETSIAVGLVDADRGGRWGELGQLFEQVLVADPDGSSLPAELRFTLFDVRVIEDEAQARRLVERGRLAAALIIPPDFSQALATGNATARVLVDGRTPALGAAFRAAVEALADTISAGVVTIRTTADGLLGNPRLRAQLMAGELDEALIGLAVDAALPAANPIQIRRLSPASQPAPLRLTHYLAATIAITMLGLTSLLVSATLFQERAQWTLQRAYITPTRPGIILLGKTLGVYLVGLVQVTALIGGLALLERALGAGNPTSRGVQAGPAWTRPDLPGLASLVCAVVLAATGYGAAIAGAARSYAEAALLGGTLLIVLGLAGGIFFPVELMPGPLHLLSRGTPQFWAMDGYLRLARGEGAAAIAPNLLVLIVFGLVTIAAGAWLTRRRIELV